MSPAGGAGAAAAAKAAAAAGRGARKTGAGGSTARDKFPMTDEIPDNFPAGLRVLVVVRRAAPRHRIARLHPAELKDLGTP